MILPSALKKGDAVALVATARKVSPQEMEPAIRIIENNGFRVLCGKNLYNAFHQFSGTDEERAEDLQWAVNDPEVKAIVVARGGYGTMRIIDRVDFSCLKKEPKWICGYSDVTVLHNHLHQHLQLATLHCTMPINFEKNNEATSSLFAALRGEINEYHWEGHPLNKPGTAKGILIGGNLSLLFALTGTDSDVDTAGKILFLEDLDEYLYHIDRMMMGLRKAGKLDRLAGLIVGGLTEMKDNAVAFGKTAEEIILDAVRDYNFPVCFNFPAGHIDRNMAIYLGKKISLNSALSKASILY